MDYLQHQSRSLHLPIDLSPTPRFARSVLEALLAVPFGKVTTYGGLARMVGADPGSARAVGRAVAANPLPIVVPCHRVVRSDGTLGGYSGGLHRKVALLRLEEVEVTGSRQDARVTPGGLSLPL